MTDVAPNQDASEEEVHSTFVLYLRWAIFFGFHLTPFLLIWAGVSYWAVGLMVLLYVVRMFGITAGYHRYFAHRSFKTSRWFQFVLALLGTLSIQKGVLWWAGHHRDHHAYSDQPEDIHSPVQHGFWWAHMGWFLGTKYWQTPMHRIKDFASYPELLWLNTYWVVPFVLLCIGVFFGFGFTLGFDIGFQALVWGGFVSTVFTFHFTFFINSLAHVWGWRVFETRDQSRNNLLLAFFTMGEGWHNNHHKYPNSARQGFLWWEFDFSWYILWCLEKIGIIWDVKRPPNSLLQERLSAKRV